MSSLHRLEQSELDLAAAVLSAVIEQGRPAYDRLCISASLATDQALRADVIAILTRMIYLGLYKRRWTFRLPTRENQEHIVRWLKDSPEFGDLLDEAEARDLLRWACDREAHAPVPTMEVMHTHVLVCAYIFGTELRDWKRAYRAWARSMRRRLGVRESFRKGFSAAP